MKPTLLMATALLLNLTAPATRAQDLAPGAPAKCEMCAKCQMCEMMMMKKTAPAGPQMNAQIAELDRLLTEMNGSLGPRKLEAMAAVVTRLVAQYKQQAEMKPAPPPAPPQEEAHQH